MSRFALSAAAVLLLAAAPAVSQTTPPRVPAQKTSPQISPQTSDPAAASPIPGSDEWLRLRDESYTARTDAEPDPAEVAATASLNAGITARNADAERREAEGLAAFEAENARWRAETARLETQRAQWESDAAAAAAARARYERERAAWEAEMAACRRSGRTCLTAAPGY